MADARAASPTTARIVAAPTTVPRSTDTPGRWSLVSTWHRLATGRLVDWLVVLLIAAYVVASVPALPRCPPFTKDGARERTLSWVATGGGPSAERMNGHRGFPTWGNGGVQGFPAAVI